MASGCQDKKVRVFDLTQTIAEPLVLEGHSDTIRAVSFLPNCDSRLLLSAGGDKSLRLWDTRTGGATAVSVVATALPVMSLSMNLATAQAVVATGRDMQIYDVSRGFELQSTVTLTENVLSAALSPDGKLLAAGGGDNRVHVVSASAAEGAEGKPIPAPGQLKGHHGPAHSVAFAPTGENLASGSEDGTVRLWPRALYQTTE